MFDVDWALVRLCVLGCFAPDALNVWGSVCDAQLARVAPRSMFRAKVPFNSPCELSGTYNTIYIYIYTYSL